MLASSELARRTSSSSSSSGIITKSRKDNRNHQSHQFLPTYANATSSNRPPPKSSLGGGGGGVWGGFFYVDAFPALLFCGILSVFLTCGTLYSLGLASFRPGLNLELSDALLLNDKIMEDMENYRNDLDEADKRSQVLQRDNDKLIKETLEVRDSDLDMDYMVDIIKEEEKRSKERVLNLQEEIQKICKTEVLEKFGPGPHKVELNLEFPPAAAEAEGEGGGGGGGGEGGEDWTLSKVVVELAPLDLMPHSVHMFLEMINHGLWNGCAFTGRARHIIMATELPYGKKQNSKENNNMRQPFIDANHIFLSFQEYSTSFTHKKYTLGFAGRPPGPGFYVNMIDNTKNHGPNGYKPDPDPCFAKVVEGFDVIDKIHSLNSDENGHLNPRVGIAHAKVLGMKKKHEHHERHEHEHEHQHEHEHGGEQHGT